MLSLSAVKKGCWTTCRYHSEDTAAKYVFGSLTSTVKKKSTIDSESERVV